MKRFFYTALAVVMLSATLCGCTVTTTVEQKYNDNFADSYASDKEVDENGNITYKFDDDKYEQFADDYHDVVKEESRLEIKSSGQYSYYNPEITEIVVGVTPEAYEEMGEDALKDEAMKVGQAAMKYQMNMKNPKGELTVTYKNANTNEEYFTVKIEA